jgi:hypothetical protein
VKRLIGICMILAGLLWSGGASAGEISLAWDPVAGAAGYHVYYGTQPGVYGAPLQTSAALCVLVGLDDCTEYFVEVRAFDATGELPATVNNVRRTDVFGGIEQPSGASNMISGWAAPVVTTVSPAQVLQGSLGVEVVISGSNFQPGSIVDFENPTLTITNVTVTGCTSMTVTVDLLPWTLIGFFPVRVITPDAVTGVRLGAFEVLFDWRRIDFDLNHRIDGFDVFELGDRFGDYAGSPTFDPHYDMNGDGWIDGQDLAYLASHMNRYLP